MYDLRFSRRSLLALPLAAMLPMGASARFAPPASARKLAEQPVTLSERRMIWQATSYAGFGESNPPWPFHSGFIAAFDSVLSLRGESGDTVVSLQPNSAFAVSEETRFAPVADTDAATFLAVELVQQDDSDNAYRRPFKATPDDYLLTLWSLTATAASDDDIAALLAENLPGAPVMVYVRAGGISVAGGDAESTILQGNWDALDADSVVSVPGGVTAELLIATITGSERAGGDNDLGSGAPAAETTSATSTFPLKQVPSVDLVNYRTASFDAAELTWQMQTGLADPEPGEELRYQRGFITALNGPIALFEDNDTFRRIGGGNAITVRRGDRFAAQSLSGAQELFLAIELPAAEDARDASAPTFPIEKGQFTFELWRTALDSGEQPDLEQFLAQSPYPSLLIVQRGTLRVGSDSIAAGLARIVAPDSAVTATGAVPLLIARLMPL
jgi:hypothetical protein